ncbi:hypothetical protein SEVIR_9G508900v4 [Setaria viridis]|nr:vicilin-like seed storage protein At2g18540 [Setaria viridis]
MAGVTARWLVLLVVAVSAAATAVSASGKHERWRMSGRVGGLVVEKERRRVVAEAEAGTVTAVDVADAAGTAYRLHFITMDAGALFLPVQLHADMVFYVHSGRGKVTYIEEESSERSSLEVERGDVYNLDQGSIIFIQSYPNATRQRLRIYAIFTSEGINADDPSKPKVEAYSSVSNLLKGFETEVLRLGFGVQREVAEAIKTAKIPPLIIPYNPHEKGDEEKPNWTEDIVDALLGVRDPEEFINNKKKDKHKKKKDKKSRSKAFNFYSGKPDVHNCYGWSRTMTNKDLDALHGSNIGMFMVNLTTGSMVGPHWNPKATEIAIVTEGTGIVQTVCPSSSNPSGESRRGHRGDERGRPGGRGDEKGEGKGWVRCRNTVFRVKEGDVFVVPRFHPMAQMSFNNDSFVFVGFSTHMGQNHPQFLAGKGSVLQAIGKEVLALSLGQENSTAVGKLLSAQRDSTILSCISCAEELEEKAAEEERRRREEEGGGKGPGEREEEKERREREEEERRKEEEKERREREEEERKREEEERERKEEEERQRRKEEERERREQEEKQRREEEERARREEEQRQREEEERQREEEERRREEEEGGGGHGDEPESDEPLLYRLSKKLKKRYRAGTFKSG